MNGNARMLDEQTTPNMKTIYEHIGVETKPAWLELQAFLDTNYDLTPEIHFYGKKYGWSVRYRKSGKTLCTLFPENGSYTVLITLGKKEREKLSDIFGTLNDIIANIIRNTTIYHDGQWLWIQVRETTEVEDIKKLIQIKKRIKSRK